MANVQKYTAAAGGHMLKHYTRAKDETGAYIKFGNTQINTENTPTNYSLHADRKTFVEMNAYAQSHSKKKLRSNINVMCSWVVTLPIDVKWEDEQKFFQSSYDFLCH